MTRSEQILSTIARTGRFYAVTAADLSAVRSLESRGLVRSARVLVGGNLSTVRVTAA